MNTSGLSELSRRTEPPPISWLMQLALSHPKLISLAAGFTDNESLPVDEVRELMAGMLRSPRVGRAALQYGSTRGDAVLRRLTAQHLRQLDLRAGKPTAILKNSSRSEHGQAQTAAAIDVHVVSELAPTERELGETCSPDRMIITNGSQQMLYMVTEALCDTGDIVLVEDPTYFVYLGIVQSRGLRARGVRMENDGLDLAHLDAVLRSLKRGGDLRRVKLLYLVSYFQNPTGITTSFEKKSGLLALLRTYERAAGHPIYLLEDSAYRELRFRGDDVRSALAARGSRSRVIFTGTYSKPFATGTRVGFGILPEPLFTAVLRIKGNHDFGTSNLLQQLLSHALSSGRYARHLRELQKRYGRKAGVMLQALQNYFPDQVEWLEPNGGLYFWARLPRGLRSGMKSKLFRAALAKNVMYVPGALCYADDPTRRKRDNEMRISFGSASEADIREGIRRLGMVLRNSF